jgi:hypothetical protein
VQPVQRKGDTYGLRNEAEADEEVHDSDDMSDLPGPTGGMTLDRGSGPTAR